MNEGIIGIYLNTYSSPTAKDYVEKLEARLEREKSGDGGGLCKQLCDVAKEVLTSELKAGNISLEEKMALSDRILVAEVWLIENDRWF